MNNIPVILYNLKSNNDIDFTYDENWQNFVESEKGGECSPEVIGEFIVDMLEKAEGKIDGWDFAPVENNFELKDVD